MDNTLLDGWAGQEFVRYFVRRHPLALVTLARWLRRGAGILRSGLDQAGAVETGASFLAGTPEEEVRRLAQECFEHRLQDRLFDAGIARVAAAQRAGAYVMLASGSSIYVVEAIGNFLGVDRSLGTRTVVEDGKLTGRPELPLCFGEGKRRLVERALREVGVPLSRTTFYSDSEVDLPLLEVVGRPVVVNPSPALRLVARGRGWEEEYWAEEQGGRRRRR